MSSYVDPQADALGQFKPAAKPVIVIASRPVSKQTPSDNIAQSSAQSDIEAIRARAAALLKDLAAKKSGSAQPTTQPTVQPTVQHATPFQVRAVVAKPVPSQTEQLSAQLRVAKEELQKLSETITAQNSELTAMGNERDALLAQLSAMTSEVDEYMQQNSSLEVQSLNYRTANGMLESKVGDLTAKCEALTHQVSKSDDILAQFILKSEQCLDLQEQFSTLQAEFDSLKAQYANMHADLTENIRHRNAVISRLEQQNKNLVAENTNMKESLEKMKQVLAALIGN